MNGIIYCITNLSNNKKYIGQTRTSLNVRYSHHLTASRDSKPQGIAAAIKKYGENNFTIEKIDECPISKLDMLEMYYIKKYNTYENGYNRTLGGSGFKKLKFNINEIIQKYQELESIKETAEHFNCCEKTISNILHNNNVKIIKKGRKENLIYPPVPRVKKIKIVELNKNFNSLLNCADFLLKNNYPKTKKRNSVQRGISKALTGERKSYLGFHFEYL